MKEVQVQKLIPESEEECANLSCSNCLISCPSHADNIFKLLQDFDEAESVIKEVVDALFMALKLEVIEVNDGDDEYEQGREYLLRGSNEEHFFMAHLVVEEDCSVRWYFHPNEHSDLVLFAIGVLPQCEEQWKKKTGE